MKIITAFSTSLNLPTIVQEPEVLSLNEESKRLKSARVEAANSIYVYHNA